MKPEAYSAGERMFRKRKHVSTTYGKRRHRVSSHGGESDGPHEAVSVHEFDIDWLRWRSRRAECKLERRSGRRDRLAGSDCEEREKGDRCGT